MRKQTFITALFSCLALAALSQEGPRTSITLKGTADNTPLFYVGNILTSQKYLLVDPVHIQSVNVLKGETALEKYGEKGRNGVVIIQVKPQAGLLNIDDIFNQLAVPQSERTMKVFLNDIPVTTPEQLLIDPSLLRSVQSMNEIEWDISPAARKTERSLHIRTDTEKGRLMS